MEKTAGADAPGAPPRQYSKSRTEIAPLLPAGVETALEIGCGGGETMAWLRARHPLQYAAAVELSPEDGLRARSVFDDVEISDIASARMAFAVERFDLILALDVLEHLTNPDEALRVLSTRLAPGGTIIISLPNVAHFDVSIPLLFRGRWEYGDEGLLDRTHLRFFTEATALHMIETCGLKVEKLIHNRRYPSLFHPFGLRSEKWRWYSHKILRHVLIWPPHLFKYQFLIAARLP